MSFIRWEVNGGNRLQLFGDPLKGAVHPKSKTLSSFTQPHIVIQPVCLKKKIQQRAMLWWRPMAVKLQKWPKTIIKVFNLIFFQSQTIALCEKLTEI